MWFVVNESAFCELLPLSVVIIITHSSAHEEHSFFFIVVVFSPAATSFVADILRYVPM